MASRKNNPKSGESIASVAIDGRKLLSRLNEQFQEIDRDIRYRVERVESLTEGSTAEQFAEAYGFTPALLRDIWRLLPASEDIGTLWNRLEPSVALRDFFMFQLDRADKSRRYAKGQIDYVLRRLRHESGIRQAAVLLFDDELIPAESRWRASEDDSVTLIDEDELRKLSGLHTVKILPHRQEMTGCIGVPLRNMERVLGVLAVECSGGQCDEEKQRQIQLAAAELVPHVLVWRQSEHSIPPCGWHPDLSGKGLPRQLRMLCKQIADSMGKFFPKPISVIWRIDAEKQELTPWAMSRSGPRDRSPVLLSKSILSEILASPPRAVLRMTGDALDEYPDVRKLQSPIKTVIATSVFAADGSDASHREPTAAVCLYFDAEPEQLSDCKDRLIRNLADEIGEAIRFLTHEQRLIVIAQRVFEEAKASHESEIVARQLVETTHIQSSAIQLNAPPRVLVDSVSIKEKLWLVYEALAPSLLNLAKTRTASKLGETPDDIVQHVFVVFMDKALNGTLGCLNHRRISEINVAELQERMEACRSFLVAVLLNRFRDLYRKDARRPKKGSPEQLAQSAAETSEPTNSLEGAETTEIVRAAIRHLPAHLWRVIMLRYYEELSLDKISDRLDIKLGTVKSRLNAAREMLGKLIRKRLSHD